MTLAQARAYLDAKIEILRLRDMAKVDVFICERREGFLLGFFAARNLYPPTEKLLHEFQLET